MNEPTNLPNVSVVDEAFMKIQSHADSRAASEVIRAYIAHQANLRAENDRLTQDLAELKLAVRMYGSVTKCVNCEWKQSSTNCTYDGCMTMLIDRARAELKEQD